MKIAVQGPTLYRAQLCTTFYENELHTSQCNANKMYTCSLRCCNSILYICIYIYRYMYIYIYIYIYIQLIIVLRMLSTSPHLQCEQDGEELLLVSYQHTATDTRQLFSDSVLNNDGGHILPARSDDQLCNKPNSTRSIVARQRQSSEERA